jgi:succinate dehydrogenase/fumarate reductase flavoprotein subunit
VFGRRAALTALDGPAIAGDGAVRGREAVDGAALWRDAGLSRSEDGLRRLLDSPSELVRLIARSALARTESRGVHFRDDFPSEDPSLLGHFVVRPGGDPELEPWS